MPLRIEQDSLVQGGPGDPTVARRTHRHLLGTLGDLRRIVLGG
jgi:hypothetical protein